MADTLTAAQRRDCMASVKSRNTKPELVVRSTAHGLGFRYSLHKRALPGSPDLVFTSRRKVIFVQGCFWHGHTCKRGKRVPQTNRDYWVRKIARNRVRDLENRRSLRKDGWSVLCLWECELRNRDTLRVRLRRFLGPKKTAPV